MCVYLLHLCVVVLQALYDFVVVSYDAVGSGQPFHLAHSG